MTIVDWAHVVLPMMCLVSGTYLSFRHAAVLERWVKKLDRVLREP